MMVSKLVYIEHAICIKSVTVRKTLWNMLLSKKWEKMNCTENSVHIISNLLNDLECTGCTGASTPVCQFHNWHQFDSVLDSEG